MKTNEGKTRTEQGVLDQYSGHRPAHCDAEPHYHGHIHDGLGHAGPRGQHGRAALGRLAGQPAVLYPDHDHLRPVRRGLGAHRAVLGQGGTRPGARAAVHHHESRLCGRSGVWSGRAVCAADRHGALYDPPRGHRCRCVLSAYHRLRLLHLRHQQHDYLYPARR